jgi:hypothetical protein
MNSVGLEGSGNGYDFFKARNLILDRQKETTNYLSGEVEGNYIRL